MISVPEFVHASANETNFILLGCDGIFEALSNSDVASIVGRALCESRSADLSAVLTSLLSASLEAGSRGIPEGVDWVSILIAF